MINQNFEKLTESEIRKLIVNGGINVNDDAPITSPDSMFKGKIYGFSPLLDAPLYIEDRAELMNILNMKVILHEAENEATFITKFACFRRDEETGKCYKFSKADFKESEISLSDYDLEMKYCEKKLLSPDAHIAQAKEDTKLINARMED